MCRIGWALAVLAAVGLLSGGRAAADDIYKREQLRIVMPQAGAKGLEAVLVRPAAPGRYPLALINHGSPRLAADRPGMTPFGLYAQMMEFARRGWAVAAVMRRGFGDSGGGFAEDIGTCQSPNHLAAGRSAAADLRATIAQLSGRPDIDGSRIISVGISAGGFATVALTAQPPVGLLAGINFAGGRGSQKDGEVCAADRLVAAFSAFGKTSRVPMLWVYADNDLFFGPQIAQRFHEAFTAGGGRAEFIKHPAFGRDGHALFAAGMSLWRPIVEGFLKQQNLVPRDTLLPIPVPNVTAPEGLSDNGRKAFADYLMAGPHRAFAMSPKGSFGWRSGRRTTHDARNGALENCAKHDAKCRVVFVNEEAAK